MNWLTRLLLEEFTQETTAAITNLAVEINQLKMQQAEILKVLLAANQTLAKLILQKAQEPEELTNAQRAALLGLPNQMADLVDWEQIKGRR